MTTPLLGFFLDSYCPQSIRRLLIRTRKPFKISWLALDSESQNVLYENYRNQFDVLNPPNGRALVGILRETLTGKRGLIHLLRHEDRNAMRGIVPDTILDRNDKIGFANPEREWLMSIDSKALKWLQGAEEIPFLDANAIREYFKKSIRNENGFTWQTWRMINFCQWYQLNFK